MEKRIRIKIDHKGNVSARTIEGFQGENCHEAVDVVLATINGSLKSQGATDDADKHDDPLAFIVDGPQE
jgi:hypothetical protein